MVFSAESFFVGAVVSCLGWLVGLWIGNRPPRVNVPPQTGQVWRSEYSGNIIEVTQVQITDTGSTHTWITREGCIESERYAYSLLDWERRLREEGRTLLSPIEQKAYYADR